MKLIEDFVIRGLHRGYGFIFPVCVLYSLSLRLMLFGIFTVDTGSYFRSVLRGWTGRVLSPTSHLLPKFPSLFVENLNYCFKRSHEDSSTVWQLVRGYLHVLFHLSHSQLFLYFYYVWSTFLNSCFLNSHFHHLSLSRLNCTWWSEYFLRGWG